jgi:hypothetical protein
MCPVVLGELEWCELTEQTATLEATMRRRMENLAFLAVLALLAFVLHEYSRGSVATAKPGKNAAGPVSSFIDHGSTKFDLLFRQPELALP